MFTIFTDQDTRREEQIAKFEQAWKSRPEPSIEELLIGDGEERRRLLVELLHADIELRIKSGRPSNLEHALARFGDFLQQADVLDLVAGEYRLRKRRDESVSVSQYEERFPQCHGRLADHLASIDSMLIEAADTVKSEQIHEQTKINLASPDAAAISYETGSQLLREYRIVKRIGQGGMGEVYEAIHQRLGKKVAIKILPPHLVRDEQAVGRFEREMHAVGGLSHPNIVQATDAGEVDGKHYLVMELVDGIDAAEICRQRSPLPIADACEIARQTALGLQHAADHGMVHRDIKPSNLMVTREGQVKILDLGLARVQHPPQGIELTSTGQMMGTIDYMAPEQVIYSHQVDIRADVYSLGSTLYRLLSRQAPFGDSQYNSPARKIVALEQQAPQPVDLLRPEVPPELSAILARMLSKDPADRYQQPADVAQALEPFADGADLATLTRSLTKSETDSAKRGSTFDGFASAFTDTSPKIDMPRPAVGGVPPTKRNRTWIAAALLGLAACVMAGVFLIRLATDSGELVIESSDPGLKVAVVQSGRTVKELELEQGENVLKLRTGQYEVQLAVPHDGVRVENGNVTLTRNQTTVVTVRRAAVPVVADPPATTDDEAPAVEAAGGEPLSALALVSRPAPLDGVTSWSVETANHRVAITCGAYSPDGTRLATGGADGTVRLWDAQSLELQRILLGHGSPLGSLAWSSDGRTLASAGSDVILWDAETGRLLRRLGKREVSAEALFHQMTWSPDGKRLYFTSVSTAYWMEIEVGEFLPILNSGQLYGSCIALSPDGTTLAMGNGRFVRLWDTETKKVTSSLEVSPPETAEEPATLTQPAWSPDGKQLAVVVTRINAAGSGKSVLETWDVGMQQRVGSQDVPHDARHGVSWSPDGKTIAVKGAILFWLCDVANERPPRRVSGHHSFENAAWHPTGSRFFGVPYLSDLRVYDVQQDRIVGRLRSEYPQPPASLSLSPDGRLISLAWHDQLVLWDRESLVRKRQWGAGYPYNASWSPDGELLAFRPSGKEIVIWNMNSDTQAAVVELSGTGQEQWAPNSEHLVIQDKDGGLELWNRRTETLQAIEGKHRRIWGSGGNWSHDGRWLVTGSTDGNVNVWDMSTTDAIPTALERDAAAADAWADVHEQYENYCFASWSPDDTLFAYHDGGTLHVYDREAKSNKATFRGHAGTPLPIMWIDATRLLVMEVRSLEEDFQMRIYDVAHQRLVDSFVTHSWRDPVRWTHADGDVLFYWRGSRFWKWHIGKGEHEPVSWAPTSPLVFDYNSLYATEQFGSIRLWDRKTAMSVQTLVPLPQHDKRPEALLSISPAGHVTGSTPGITRELLYVVQNETGQETLTPEEFAARYGWKNDPEQLNED